jgi:chemotaxis protein CheX
MVLDALILQTKLFLQDDMDVAVQSVELADESIQKLGLKDYTSMIGTGGKLSLMIVMSFENSLLDKLVDVFMEGEAVDADEKEEIRDSVSGETVNNIIGLALPTFPNRGKGVTITPPVSITEPGHISKHKTATIATANVTTNYGVMSLSVIDSNQE